MSLVLYYILNLVDFLLIVLLGISIISFILYHISNNFNIKYINIYGFFSSMDTFSLIMLSSAILKEITLVYCIFKIFSFSIIYLYIFLMFYFIYSLFSFKVSVFIKESLISVTEYLIIYFLSLLANFLVEVRNLQIVVYYIWILSIILVSCSIYFFSKNLSYILLKDKNVRRNLIVNE